MNQTTYFIDLFCGAGGTSTSINRVGGKVLACVNHDPNAIRSHSANHPESIHFTQEIIDHLKNIGVGVDPVIKEYKNHEVRNYSFWYHSWLEMSHLVGVLYANRKALQIHFRRVGTETIFVRHNDVEYMLYSPSGMTFLGLNNSNAVHLLEFWSIANFGTLQLLQKSIQ